MIGALVALTAVVWGAVGVVAAVRARGRAEVHHGDALMWRSAAINTAREWVRTERGEVAAKDFVDAMQTKSPTIVRENLPTLAKASAARWPHTGGAA